MKPTGPPREQPQRTTCGALPRGNAISGDAMSGAAVTPEPLSAEQIERFMLEAIREGHRAYPACLPNPPVGCVLVRGGEVIARGHTQPPFEYHAEPMALSQVEGDLPDVTAFVTLEPCSFHQRTPSCAKQMIARKVGRVYVALLDPHPRNQGAGLAMLREAGIEVIADCHSEAARPHLEPHLYQAEAPE